MSTYNIQFHDKTEKNILMFLELLGELHRDTKIDLESAMVNEPSVFEILRFDGG